MTFQRFLNQTPIAHDLPHFDPGPETDWFGIKALWYEGPQYRDKRTKVFAYIGYPNVKTGEKVPAVVLVHGGGGHAYPEWIRRWNEKGFAAIAMETTGYIPSEDWKGHVGTEEHVDGQYVHELYGELSETGYDLGPDNTEMHDFALPVENQWMYHAVADTILAHNLLLQDPKVDAAHIGIVGISWGASLRLLRSATIPDMLLPFRFTAAVILTVILVQNGYRLRFVNPRYKNNGVPQIALIGSKFLYYGNAGVRTPVSLSKETAFPIRQRERPARFCRSARICTILTGMVGIPTRATALHRLFPSADCPSFSSLPIFQAKAVSGSKSRFRRTFPGFPFVWSTVQHLWNMIVTIK